MSPRILPLDEPYTPEIAGELAAMMPPGVPPLKLFRTLAHSPRILAKVRASNLLGRGPLERRERELVILRTCARCGSEYEWGVHASVFAERVGLGHEQVEASVRGDADDPAWSERDALLIRLVDELHDASRLNEETWVRLRDGWSDEQILEILALVGFYHTISFITNGLEIDREEAAARFPRPVGLTGS